MPPHCFGEVRCYTVRTLWDLSKGTQNSKQKADFSSVLTCIKAFPQSLPCKRALEPYGADLMQRGKVALAVIAFGVYIASQREAYIVGKRIACRVCAERTICALKINLPYGLKLVW